MQMKESRDVYMHTAQSLLLRIFLEVCHALLKFPEPNEETAGQDQGRVVSGVPHAL